MPTILKTTGLVLSKLEFQESSNIVRIYTKDFGKLSFIIKGARSSRKKSGNIIDALNHIEFIFYRKESRDIQVISDASLINFFSNVKSNYESLIYSSAIIELIDKLVHESEPHERLFRGVVKILELINANPTKGGMYFVKFLFFFVDELGYKIETDNCSQCSAFLSDSKTVGFNYEFGFLCENCKKDKLTNFSFSAEQFKKVQCLSSRDSNCGASNELIEKIIEFFEKYLSYQIDEFREIKSLKLI